MTQNKLQLVIRIARNTDDEAIWSILEPIIRAGDTYALPSNMSRAQALSYWLSANHEVFVAAEGNEIVGTYYLRANQEGAAAHVANCGYMTATWASGRGIARSMCIDSLKRAKERGFRAMQFNFVVSSNDHAVKLWQSCGFQIVGQLPEAFLHPREGYVDAYVMYRKL